MPTILGTAGSPLQEIPLCAALGSATGGGSRGTPDFSFHARPASGVSVYDSTRYQGLSGWLVFGGTSVSAPSLAGIVNLAGHFNSDNGEQELIYTTYGASTGNCKYGKAFNDITSGSAGRYDAVAGSDFVTGVGSDIGCSCGK